MGWGCVWLTGSSVKFLYLPHFLTKPENKTFLEYPSCPPTLGVRNPRGLDEAAVAGLLADMNARLDFLISRLELLFFKVVFNARCEEYCGCPVLFELIEMAREFLTKRNVPVVR